MSNKETLRKQIAETKARMNRLREAKQPPSVGVAMLIESDLDKASVLLSAEAIGDSFQDMAEKIARVEANDLIPMDKALKAQFGEDAANRFYQSVQGVLRGLLDQLKQAQDAVNKQVESLRSGTPNDMAAAPDVAADPAADLGADAAAEPAPEMDMDADADADVAADPAGDAPADPDLDPSMGDDTIPGGEPAVEPEPALGRDRKMSESISDAKIVKAFVSEMQKIGDANKAARRIAEKFAIDTDDVKAIVREAASRA